MTNKQSGDCLQMNQVTNEIQQQCDVDTCSVSISSINQDVSFEEYLFVNGQQRFDLIKQNIAKIAGRQDKCGRTLLMHLMTLQDNLKSQIDIDSVEILAQKEQLIKDKQGNTSLMYAVKNQAVNVVYLLTKEIGEVNLKKQSALMIAMQNNRIDLIDLLNNEVGMQDNEGQFALMFLLRSNSKYDIKDYVEAVRKLSNKELQLQNNERQTPLMLAALYKRDDLIQNLLGSIGTCDQNGNNAIFYAIQKNPFGNQVEDEHVLNCVHELVQEIQSEQVRSQLVLVAKQNNMIKSVDIIQKHSITIVKQNVVEQHNIISRFFQQHGSEDTNEYKMLVQDIKQCIVKPNLNVTLQSIAVLENIKQILRHTIILPQKAPQLFGKNLWKGILLYGVSGTGKTFVAKVVANICGRTTYLISPSTLVSKWEGNSEKLVKILFQLAREEPSVIIIDEIDAICSSRQGKEDGTVRMKSEFLIQTDGVRPENENILLIGATNFPENLDPAMRSRFQKRVEIPLPDWEARKQMMKVCLSTEFNSVTNDQLISLKDATEGYSGRDINTLMIEAKNMNIEDIENAEWFERRLDKIYVVTKNTQGAKYMRFCNMSDEDLKKVQPLPITIDHLNRAIKISKKTVGKTDIERINAFTELFGMEG